MKAVLKAVTPTRIDLAGGTLDIYPLYQFAYPKIYTTINMAIDIFNEVILYQLNTSEIIIESKDLVSEIKFPSFIELETYLMSTQSHQLEMIIKVIYYFKIDGIKLEIKSNAPKGSGLGNSSSLLIAIIGILSCYSGENLSKSEIIAVAQGIETSMLKIPTGKQDYVAALYGGINAIKFGLIDDYVEQLEPNQEFIKKLYDRSILCYVGEPLRFISYKDNPNWDVFKRVVECDLSNLMGELNRVSELMYKTLMNSNFKQFKDIIDQETDLRKKLSKTIISDNIRQVISQIGGHVKICGAGGGGTILIIFDDTDDISNKLNLIAKLDIYPMKFKINNDGLLITRFD